MGYLTYQRHSCCLSEETKEAGVVFLNRYRLKIGVGRFTGDEIAEGKQTESRKETELKRRWSGGRKCRNAGKWNV